MTKKKYYFLFVLCPSEAIVDDRISYYNCREGEMYLGGKDRMDAVVGILENVSRVIMVGGSKTKVQCMRHYVIQEISEELDEEIICVESDPDTNGNLNAIRQWMKQWQSKKGTDKRSAILTNFYHIPRAARIASDVLKEYEFDFISAEAVLKRQAEYTLYHDGLIKRIHSEINGLSDWEKGEYRDQHKNKWKCEIVNC